jgi:hypothetical protein
MASTTSEWSKQGHSPQISEQYGSQGKEVSYSTQKKIEKSQRLKSSAVTELAVVKLMHLFDTPFPC